MSRDELQEKLELLPFGKRVGGEPDDESEHFFQCKTCGRPVDMRDLADVFWHEECRAALSPPSSETK